MSETAPQGPVQPELPFHDLEMQQRIAEANARADAHTQQIETDSQALRAQLDAMDASHQQRASSAFEEKLALKARQDFAREHGDKFSPEDQAEFERLSEQEAANAVDHYRQEVKQEFEFAQEKKALKDALKTDWDAAAALLDEHYDSAIEHNDGSIFSRLYDELSPGEKRAYLLKHAPRRESEPQPDPDVPLVEAEPIEDEPQPDPDAVPEPEPILEGTPDPDPDEQKPPQPKPQPQPEAEPEAEAPKFTVEDWNMLKPELVRSFLEKQGSNPDMITHVPGSGTTYAVYGNGHSARPAETGVVKVVDGKRVFRPTQPSAHRERAYRKFEGEQKLLLIDEEGYVVRLDELREHPELVYPGLMAEQQAWSEAYGNDVYTTRVEELRQAHTQNSIMGKGLKRKFGDLARKVKKSMLTPEEKQAREEIFGENFSGPVKTILSGANLGDEHKAERDRQATLFKQYFGDSYEDTVNNIVRLNPRFHFEIYGDKTNGKLIGADYNNRIEDEIKRRLTGYDPVENMTTEDAYEKHQEQRASLQVGVLRLAPEALQAALDAEVSRRANGQRQRGETAEQYFKRMVGEIQEGLDRTYDYNVGRAEGRFPNPRSLIEQQRMNERAMAAVKAYEDYINQL
ncbi:MAG TPA: hypothetical protein VFB59_00445 [Candidatus Saccharimonadales bacterium]|nr:hypothetical protein [Candidatus Saccharimonadales bacterium]